MQSGLLYQPIKFETLQLRTDAGIQYLGNRRQLTNRDRGPILQNVGEKLARQIGQTIHACLVKWRHVVEQGFQVAAHTAILPVSENLVEHDRGTRITAGELAQGGQSLRLGGELPLHLLACSLSAKGFGKSLERLCHLFQAQRAQGDDAEKVEEGIVIVTLCFQALIAATNPEEAGVALQGGAQRPLGIPTDVMKQKIGVIHQKEQPLSAFVGATVNDSKAGGSLLGGRQGSDTFCGGIQFADGMTQVLQGIGQTVEHIGPELAKRGHRVLLFRKTQWQPGSREFGVIFHGQG